MKEKNISFFRSPKGILFRILILAVVITAFAWVVLFRVNVFTLSVQLEGEPTVSLEYGESYEEAGAHAVLKGTLFLKEGVVPENARLSISGTVEESDPGRYILRYDAECWGFHARTERTVCIHDTVPPVLTLTEDPEGAVASGGIYQEAGFSAYDNHDGDITERVIRLEEMGRITYAVTDSSGNPAYAVREVPYHDPVPPEIHLTGGEYYAIPTGTLYKEPGYEAVDNVDGDLTEAVLSEGAVDWLKPGIYPITYTVTDAYENQTTVTRQVEVVAQPRPETVWPEEKTIYLTFDDGPSQYTRTLLDVLDKYGVKATFFVVDTQCAEVMKEITDRGHSIGLHSVSHVYSEIYSSPESFFEDLYAVQDVVYRNTGVKTTLMRFPGGSSNTVSCKFCEGIMSTLTEAVQDAGFQYFDWNLNSEDTGSARTAPKVQKTVIQGLQENPVSMVLQHDIHGFSVAAVEEILIWGLKNGYTFRPLTPDSPGFHHEVNN